MTRTRRSERQFCFFEFATRFRLGLYERFRPFVRGLGLLELGLSASELRLNLHETRGGIRKARLNESKEIACFYACSGNWEFRFYRDSELACERRGNRGAKSRFSTNLRRDWHSLDKGAAAHRLRLHQSFPLLFFEKGDAFRWLWIFCERGCIVIRENFNHTEINHRICFAGNNYTHLPVALRWKSDRR